MKLSVDFTPNLAKKYFFDSFLRKFLWVEIFLFIAGLALSLIYFIDFGTGRSITNGLLTIFVTILAIFSIALVEYFPSRKQLNEISRNKSNIYDFEFLDTHFIVTHLTFEKVFYYTQIKKVIDAKYYISLTFDSGTMYILDKEKMTKDEIIEILRLTKKIR